MGIRMFDIGLNLTSSQFAKDRDEVVARAFAAGVKGLLLTGTNLHESEQAQQLAQRYERCWSTAGVHPHDSSQWTAESGETLRRLAKTPEVVAIGECGLDFNRNFSTPEEQEKAFTAQLALAAELEMPVFMHCRDAHERFWRCWIRGWRNCPARCCTASPVHGRRRWIAWSAGFIWVLPAGFAMSAAGLSFVSCCR
jgi:TatD DNase family protein